MEYRSLGTTGIKVSLLGFGTWGIGGPCMMGSKNVGAASISRKDAIETLLFAQENGINFFDTSPTYGNAEELLGQAFHQRRDKVIVASKIGLTASGEFQYSKENVEKAISNTLRNIGSDYIDILQFMTPQSYRMEPEAIISLLNTYRRSGKIRHIGISLHNFKEGQDLIDNPDLDIYQVFYNLLDIRAKEFIEKAKKRGRAIIIKSPLNKGILAGHYTKGTKFPPEDIRNSYLKGKALDKRLEWINRFLDTFGIERKELFTYIVNYLSSKPHIDSILFGFKNSDHIARAFAACKQENFTEKQISAIETFSERNIDTLDDYFKSVLDFWRK